MWSRSTKQRRAAMRRRQAGKGRCTMAQFQAALNVLHDAGRLVPFARLRTAEEQNALYEQRPFVPSPRTSPHAALFRTLVYAEPPKETK